MSSIARLIEIASAPICAEFTDAHLAAIGSPLHPTLCAMLQQKNGFYAFESALHVFPDCPTAPGYSLSEWNAPELWTSNFGGRIMELTCFAEDLFGEQFCMDTDGKTFRFNPETNAIDAYANDLEGWADRIMDLNRYNIETGYSAGHDWQMRNGHLPIGKRLVPKQLFTLGGKYTADNLGVVSAVEGMCYRAHVWQQVKDLPEGTIIRLTFT